MIYVEVWNGCHDYTDAFEIRCSKLGARLFGFEKFAAFKKKPLTKPKPDVIVWSDGDPDVLELAEKHGIAIVSTKWVAE